MMKKETWNQGKQKHKNTSKRNIKKTKSIRRIEEGEYNNVEFHEKYDHKLVNKIVNIFYSLLVHV